MSWPNREEPAEGRGSSLNGLSAASEAAGVTRRTSPRVTFTDADDAAEAGGFLGGAGEAGASLIDSAPVTPSYGNYGRNTPSILNLNYRKDSSGVSRKPTERDPLLLESWKKTDDELQALKKSRQGRKVARFYKHQNEQIDNLLAHVDEHDDTGDKRVRFALRASVAANVLLFGLQAYAASTSGSLSLFATMADAFMDLLSSLVLLVAERISGKGNRDKYPTGATRMETAGIIVFSCLMSTVSIQLLIESVKKLIEGNEGDAVDVSVVGASCLAFALFSKLCLYILCARRANGSHTCRTLAQDHRNDLLVNGFGLAASLLGTNIVWWVDPAGAIIIALIILKSWASTAYECIQLIVGKSAQPHFLSKIIYLAVTHHPLILQVDTCRAYHAGPGFYVEVDIVVDPDMKVRTAHDIAESLQTKIEKLPEVERAFVHIDYEITHKATDEHKRV